MGKWRAKLRPNGQEPDVKAPDGFLLGGWRRVARGGFVRLLGVRWFHEDFRGMAGQYVFVHIDDPLGAEASYAPNDEARWYGPLNGREYPNGRKIMTAESDWRKECTS